jgi:hypothetical protein
MNTALSRDRDIDARPFYSSDIPIDRTLIRAMTSAVVAEARQRPPSHASVIARETWERDRVTPALLTRAVAPADTTTSGWASQLAAKAVAAFISSLAPQSAARLIEAGVTVSFDGIATVTLPWATSNPEPTFVAEGGAIPVNQAAIGSIRA